MNNFKNNKPKRPTKATLDALFGTHDFKTYAELPSYEPKVKTKRKRNPFRLYEDRLQKQVVKWFGLQYPNLKDLLCYNLNNSTNQITGAINKSLGLTTGRNDLSLYYKGRALLLELKSPDGKQSKTQQQFEATCIKHGNHYRIAWEFDQAQEIIRKFITWADGQ
jgi:hypothetical protein